MEELILPSNDVDKAVKIFDMVIKGFKIPDTPTNEQAKEFYKEDGSLDFGKIPNISISTWDNGTKFLNLVYFYNGFLTVNADCNPVPVIIGFLDAARKYVSTSFPQTSADDIEEWVFYESLKMCSSFVSRIRQRMDLAIRSYTDEVLHSWFIEWKRWEKTFSKENGIEFQALKEKEFFRNLQKTHENYVVDLFFNVTDKSLEEKKIKLSKDYDSIFNHWKKLRKEYSGGNPDWREYAQAGNKFSDTPDDLIDALEDCLDIASLALEHAGRRAGLMNPDMKKDDLEKRQQKILVTGYSSRRLRDFKVEGDKLFDGNEKII